MKVIQCPVTTSVLGEKITEMENKSVILRDKSLTLR